MALSVSLLRRRSPFLRLVRLTTSRLLSTSPPLPQTPPDPSSPTSSLSSRMSFVFDQLDALHRDRQEKDDALRRIRAWRHSNHPPDAPEEPSKEAPMDIAFRSEVQLVHPWPEWIELVERLLQQNYFDYTRISGDAEAPDDSVGLELTRGWPSICTAVENFGKDRFDILKSLSRMDIGTLVGHGCPSTDGKVVYSAKLLRKHVHVNEGDVCSACSLRSTCRKGFLVLPREDEARTLDVMRVLLTFAFDSINGSVKNEPLLKMKSVKTVIRKLLHEIAKLSAVPLDPNLPRPIIKKAPPKVKQTPPPPKKRVGRDDVEMKKGDWLCPKCDFMNFAKNLICLQCDAKRPKRQLLPGEWECPQCNFLNYRRNMACFHCECKRPPDDYIENQVNTKQHDTQTTRSKGLRIPNVSDSWNLDFDDNESDGADVAAFEFADPSSAGNASKLGGLPDGVKGFNNSFVENHEKQRTYKSGYSPESQNNQMNDTMTGFDDFDDEEDDIDNYEILPNGEHVSQISHSNLSEFDIASDSEEIDQIGRQLKGGKNVRTSVSSSEDSALESDSEIDSSSPSDWKSSQRRGRSFPSDSDQAIDSDSDDLGEDSVYNMRGSSRQRSDTHVGRRRSLPDVKQNKRGFPRDDADSYRRPLRGDRIEYNHRKNTMVPDRDDFSRSSQRYRGRKSEPFSRPLRGERLGYNQHRTSNQYNERSGGFDHKQHRRIIER